MTLTPEALKSRRKALKLTQEAFAAHCFVTKRSVENWEQGAPHGRRMSEAMQRYLESILRKLEGRRT